MEFSEDLEQYVYEYEGLIFVWDEEPFEFSDNSFEKLQYFSIDG